MRHSTLLCIKRLLASELELLRTWKKIWKRGRGWVEGSSNRSSVVFFSTPGQRERDDVTVYRILTHSLNINYTTILSVI